MTDTPSRAGASPMNRYDLYGTRFPLLPLKNVVIFPRNVVTMLVGRSRSIQAVEEAITRDRRIVVTAHRSPEIDDPRPDDLHTVGTLVEIVSVERQQGTNIQVVLEGLSRVFIDNFDNSRSFYWVTTELVTEAEPDQIEATTLSGMVKDLIKNYNEAKQKINPDVLEMILQTNEPSHLADLVTTQLISEARQRQEFLETVDPVKRLERLAVHLSSEEELWTTDQRIKERVREQIDRNQREYFLRTQLKMIHDELAGEGGNEIEALREKIRAKELPESVAEKLNRELNRLEHMPTVSAEATIVRNYIDQMLSLPWNERSEDILDLDHAEEVLDADHYGLEQVKERVLEFLAVRSLTMKLPEATGGATILCFAGPPGVGKTSLGRSVARAMGRQFVRVSLGGVRDEAEIRGHRRTYIGAYPGRIIGAMKTAGTLNPVILLDEVDKLASDYRGDPASALLEVLDPEQNRFFTDHFLDVPYDLSDVLFITTANQLGTIPGPLRDRLEVIEISGYTEDEKIGIGQNHLLPRQLGNHGLEPGSFDLADKLWLQLIRHYTREAGVRGLDRQLATLCRKVARDVVKGKGKARKVRLTQAKLEEYLGPQLFGFVHQFSEPLVGVAIGLGTTSVGGELIPVEVATMPGKGNLTITGQAGDVMQESARAALSYARSRARQLHIAPDLPDRTDIHIHMPEGATPKDGPSAGITMATALISALTDQPVRNDVAMTGEITLRGRVLPIGGLKDKALAAHRAGIQTVIAPKENERDLVKIPEKIQKEVTFVWVENMDQVISEALVEVDKAIGAPDEGEDRPLRMPVTETVSELPADASDGTL